MAVQVTYVLPISKILPLGGSQVTSTFSSTRSEAMGVSYVTTAPLELVASQAPPSVGLPMLVILFMSMGQSTSGAVVSTTTIGKVHSLLHTPSVAVQVTYETPIGNSEPLGLTQVTVASTAVGVV